MLLNLLKSNDSAYFDRAHDHGTLLAIPGHMEGATFEWFLADEQMYMLRWGEDEWAVQLVSGRWLVWHFAPETPLEPDLLAHVWPDEWEGMPCVSHHLSLAAAQGAVIAQIYERTFDNVVAFASHPMRRLKVG